MRRSALTAALLGIAGCVNVYPPNAAPAPAAAPAQATSATAGAVAGAASATPAGAASAASAAKDPFKPWKDVVKDTRAIDGYFKTHLKRDQTLYLELSPSQLEKDFGLVLHQSRGVSDYGMNKGLPLSEMKLMRFRRVGDKIQLVHVNPRFTADAGSPMRRAVEEDVGHSIVAAFKIESQDTATKAVLVDVSPWLVSDYGQAGEALKWAHNRKPVMLDKERSNVAKVAGFPKNLEIDVDLTYTTGEPSPWAGNGVSDWRSIPLGVRYSFIALPEAPMQPRQGDPRVGYFLDAVYDFSRDRAADPYVTYVNRWRLEKKNPAEAVSEPVQPIVYYIDHTVPKEYRRFVKEGVEAWNKGFERAGFRNAIVAREAPESDSTWSAEDARYSTIRWSGDTGGWAIGPSQTDPRTGEILNADILIAAGFTRYYNMEYQNLVGPEAMQQEVEKMHELRQRLPGHLADRLCMAEIGKAHQLGVQHALLAGLGVIDGTKPMPEAYLGDAIRDLVMHEVGHTLGLRHNFKSSSAVPYDRLNDKEFTRQNGMATSVMDYLAVNISPDPKRQGHYTNMEVGAYDVWAIQYGYTPLGKSSAREELPELQKIAGRSAEPLLAYNTDEDTHLGPWSLDPGSSTWDVGSDPLAFARDRRTIINRVFPALEQRVIADGQAYPRLRNAVSSLIVERYISLVPLTKVVGGIHFARDLRGDPNGRSPFTPVSAARQREAVQLLVEEAFAPNAFRFDPALLNKLAPSRLMHWGTPWFTTPIDYPVHSQVGGLQASLLSQLLHPARLERMIDNELRMPGDGEAYTTGELFQTVGDAIWSETVSRTRPQRINSMRRNLQREHAALLARYLLGTGGMRYTESGPVPLRVPEHVRSLARLELTELSAQLAGALASGAEIDRDTRAHLLETKARIDRALEASMTVTQ